MGTEYCRPTSYTGTGVTNGANAYDADTTTYATHSHPATTGAYTATTSTFSSKSQTWTAANLRIKYYIATAGDGGVTQWDSTGDIDYSLDGGSSWITTSLTAPSFTGDNPGSEGPYDDTISISTSQDPTQVQVRTQVSGHANTGKPPDNILGAIGTVRLYEAWIEGTYTDTPTVTSLNGGTSCTIGNSFDIVGTNFTGATSVSINSVSCSYSVTNSTTISVTIPPMYITSNITNCSVSVTTSAGTGSANVGNITCPSVSFSPSISSITQNTSQEFTATISNINPTTAHWYASSGSFSGTTTNPSTWTAPNPPLSDGYSTSVTVWPDANTGQSVPSANQSIAVYYPAVATSLATNHSYVTNGNQATLTPTFSGGSGHAYIGTTNGGSQVTAAASSGTGYAVTPPSNATTTYYLHVQNAATTNTSTASTSVNVTAVPAASITSFTYGVSPISYGNQTTLYPNFTNTSPASNTIGTTSGGSQVTGSATSGGAYFTGALYSSTTFYLRCTNLASDYVESNITVTVVGWPVATSLTPSTTSPLYGDSVTLTPSFTQDYPYGGSLVALIGYNGNQSSEISNNATSGVGVSSGAITTTRTFTLSVQNDAGDWAFVNSATVTPQTVSVSAINSGSRTRVQRLHTISLSATITGASNTNVNWSAPSGSFNPSTTASGASTTWTAPTLKGNYLVTATSAADGSKTSTLTLEVVTGSGKKATGSSF